MLIGIIIALLIACAVSAIWTDGITHITWSDIEKDIKKNDK